LVIALCMITSTIASTFTVTNTNDSGVGTLRQAITDANSTPGVDTISFNIPATDPRCNASTHVCTISPESSLPPVNDSVIVDGYTQPGASPNTLAMGDNAVVLIQLSGTALGTARLDGLDLNAGGSTVRGLVINGFFGRGLSLNGSGNVIEGNFIGTDPKATKGVENFEAGIVISGGSQNNIIGGTTLAARNIIAGNGRDVELLITDPGSNGNLIEGNYVGINAVGDTAISASTGSDESGARIDIVDGASNNVIGGTTASARNVIAPGLRGSDCHTAGVYLGSSTATNQIFYQGSNSAAIVSGNQILGNFIGTNVSGRGPLTNASGLLGPGIFIQVTGQNNIIGGTAASAGNVISLLPYDAISIGGTGNIIQGNHIGTDLTNTMSLGNDGDGVQTLDVYGAINNTIGGTVPGAGNFIAFNLGNGVAIGTGYKATQSNYSNAILGNAIYSNGGLGIDLGGDGVTPNHSGGAGIGPNKLQNYPILTSASNGGNNISIAGTLNSAPNMTFHVEFFANAAANASSFGEGQTFLGSQNVMTDNTGNAAFNAVLQIAPPSGQDIITATATDPGNDTSEFSNAIKLGSAPAQLRNISTRLRVLANDNVLIGGFIITGSAPKKVIIRAIGPSLPLPGTLADPTLELHSPDGSVVSNDNWKVDDQTGQSQEAVIRATTIPPSSDLESALVQTLAPGNYTAIVRGKNGGTGIGVVEAYDLDQAPSSSRLANISTRGFVDTGDNVMIGGLILSPNGTGAAKVIVRAIGPSLTAVGVQGALADPTLELHDGSGTTIASNDNWKLRPDGSSQQAEIEATTIPPANDLESAIVSALPPGNYTAVVRGKNNSTGVGLVEVYNLQ
jgi:hypothetical protein